MSHLAVVPHLKAKRGALEKMQPGPSLVFRVLEISLSGQIWLYPFIGSLCCDVLRVGDPFIPFILGKGDSGFL